MYINISVSQQKWFKIKWNALWCKVKREGAIYGKEELSVFTFYMVKKFGKTFKWKSVCKGGRGREDTLANKLNSAKKFKRQLLMVPRLSSLLYADNRLDMILRENR